MTPAYLIPSPGREALEPACPRSSESSPAAALSAQCSPSSAVRPPLREVPPLPCRAPSLHRAGSRQHTSPLPRAPSQCGPLPRSCAAPRYVPPPNPAEHPPRRATPNSPLPLSSEPRGISARSLPRGPEVRSAPQPSSANAGSARPPAPSASPQPK